MTEGYGLKTRIDIEMHMLSNSTNIDMKIRSRELRQNGTPAEKTLWKMLKNKQVCGLRFRRQVIIGDHILDFYCPDLRIAIELDGDYHYHGAKPEIDHFRDNDLWYNHNIRTLRFENKIIFEQPEVIIQSIKHEKEVAESGFIIANEV